VIFVTVGMHSEGFERLVREMDRIALRLGEEVIMQIGSTPYTPQSAQWFRFSTQAEIERLASDAHVVVSHAGAGSILTFLNCGTPLVVMPRLAQYGEVVDDHQMELAEALSHDGIIQVAHDGEELLAKISMIDSLPQHTPQREPLLRAVRCAVVGEACV